MATDSKYQGFTNYETWAVCLWIDNDEPLYRESVDQLTECIRTNDDIDAARYEFADWLKSWIEEMTPDMGASLWSDLLRGALSDVDWQDAAEHYITDSDFADAHPSEETA